MSGNKPLTPTQRRAWERYQADRKRAEADRRKAREAYLAAPSKATEAAFAAAIKRADAIAWAGPRRSPAPDVPLDLTKARARRKRKVKLPVAENPGPPDTLHEAVSKSRQPAGRRIDLSAVLAERRAETGVPEPRPAKPEGAGNVRGRDGSARWYWVDPAFWTRRHVIDDLTHEGPFDSISMSKGTLPGPEAGRCSARGDDDGAWLTIVIDAERSGTDIGKFVNHELAHAAHLCALGEAWPDLHGEREAVAAAEAWAEAMESENWGWGTGSDLIREARKVFGLGGDPDDWRWS